MQEYSRLCIDVIWVLIYINYEFGVYCILAHCATAQRRVTHTPFLKVQNLICAENRRESDWEWELPIQWYENLGGNGNGIFPFHSTLLSMKWHRTATGSFTGRLLRFFLKNDLHSGWKLQSSSAVSNSIGILEIWQWKHNVSYLWWLSNRLS